MMLPSGCKQQNYDKSSHHNDPVRPGTVNRSSEPLPGLVVELTSGRVVVAWNKKGKTVMKGSDRCKSWLAVILVYFKEPGILLYCSPCHLCYKGSKHN